MGAQEGLKLCIKTVIPSLLPFFFLSTLLTNELTGKRLPPLKPLGNLLRLPDGMEFSFLIGILGGYPVGAKTIAQAHQLGRLDRYSAERMLGFCSNAGPSFIFGILSGLFRSPGAAWVLWLIHIISALLVGILLPGEGANTASGLENESITVTTALTRSLRIMANVCGWVILFRVVISFLSRWILWVFPSALQIIIIGLLELTNGCCMLELIENEGLRFILASCILAFGGSCVGMQTMAVTGKLGTGLYFPGKIMQAIFSFLMAWIYQMLCYPTASKVMIDPCVLLPVIITPLLILQYLKKRKNNSSIPALSDV